MKQRPEILNNLPSHSVNEDCSPCNLAPDLLCYDGSCFTRKVYNMGKVEWRYLKMIDADYSAARGSPRRKVLINWRQVGGEKLESKTQEK